MAEDIRLGGPGLARLPEFSGGEVDGGGHLGPLGVHPHEEVRDLVNRVAPLANLVGVGAAGVVEGLAGTDGEHAAKAFLADEAVVDERGDVALEVGGIGSVTASLVLEARRDARLRGEVGDLLERGPADRPVVRLALDAAQDLNQGDPAWRNPVGCVLTGRRGRRGQRGCLVA